MTEQHSSIERRDRIRQLVVREATTLRRKRRARLAGVACMFVLVPSVIAWTWSTMGRHPSPGNHPSPHQPPVAANPPSPPLFRELAVDPASPSGVVIIAGDAEVRPLVTGRPSPVRYLDDHELLRLLDDAGQPSGVVHAGGVTRVVALSPPGINAPK